MKKQRRRPRPVVLAVIVASLLIAWRIWSDSQERDLGTAESTQVPQREDAEVSRVLDGDTLELTDGTRVRLLGIDAPEVAHEGSAAEPFADESTTELRHILGSGPVTLESGPEAVDRYGRRLAWVITSEGELVNQIMLRRGAARLLDSFGLPARYEDALRDAEASAKAEQRGVWQRPQ